MRWAILLVACVLLGCDDDVPVYADGTPWGAVVPLSPGAVLPRDMDTRQWGSFVTQAGIQADRRIRTFTPVWSGFSVDPVGDLSYYDFGRLVVIWNDTANIIVGTSDDTNMSLSNLPDEITPDNNVIGMTFVIDNGGAYAGQFSVVTTGTLGFNLLSVSGGLIQGGIGGLFTGAGNKGLPSGWLIMYAK